MSTEPVDTDRRHRHDPYDDEIDVRQYARVLWRYRVIVTLITLAGGGIAYGVSKLTTPVYQATARLRIAEQVGAPITAELIGRYRTVFEDPSLSVHVVEELGLDKPPIGLRPEQFRAAISASSGTTPDVVLVDVTLPDASLAARAATAAARWGVTLAREQERKVAEASQAVRLAEVRQADNLLLQSQASLAEFRRHTPVEALRTDSGSDVKRRDLIGVLDQIRAESVRLLAAETRLAQTPRVTPTATGESPNPEFAAASQEVGACRANLTALESKRDQLRDGTNQLGYLESEVARLQRLRNTLASAYDTEVFQASATAGSRLALQNVAPVPARASSPHTSRNTAVGLAAGLFMSVIGVLFVSSAFSKN